MKFRTTHRPDWRRIGLGRRKCAICGDIEERRRVPLRVALRWAIVGEWEFESSAEGRAFRSQLRDEAREEGNRVELPPDLPGAEHVIGRPFRW